jgi:hypothetical protein
MFKPDEYGATFFFIDFDYNQTGNKSISLAYFEIARYINLPWVQGLSVTVQYNDGVAPWGPLGSIWLGGLSYPIDLGFITLNTDILYRNNYLYDGSDVQLTTVWNKSFMEGKLTFMGFFDVWTQNDGSDGRDIVVFTEPQLWYNFGKHFSAGTEIELSRKFIDPNSEDWEIKPTAAVKWSF